MSPGSEVAVLGGASESSRRRWLRSIRRVRVDRGTDLTCAKSGPSDVRSRSEAVGIPCRGQRPPWPYEGSWSRTLLS